MLILLIPFYPNMVYALRAMLMLAALSPDQHKDFVAVRSCSSNHRLCRMKFPLGLMLDSSFFRLKKNEYKKNRRKKYITANIYILFIFLIVVE